MKITPEKNLTDFQCPFVYSTGKRCTGSVYRFKVYGREAATNPASAYMIRVWCSEKDDHCAPTTKNVGKERMEFSPKSLEPELLQFICDAVRSEGST